MGLQLTGSIKEIKPTQTGTSKAGKEWQKLTFVIANNGGYEGKEQIFAFEYFGEERVAESLQFNKIRNNVDVDFYISTNECQGKYFTSLSAWRIFGAKGKEVATDVGVPAEELAIDEMPF